MTAVWEGRLTGEHTVGRGDGETLTTVRRRTGRSRWEASYVRAVVLVDLAVGAMATLAGYTAEYARGGQLPAGWHILLAVLLPVGWVGGVALSGGYERRHLFVGMDEYQRILRVGVAVAAAIAFLAFLVDLTVARSYVLVALPAATLLGIGGRLLLRRWAYRQHAAGRYLRRVVAIGHDSAVVDLHRQLCRERYHGMEVVGAVLPDRRSPRLAGADLPVYGTFDTVAEAVERARADTAVVLSCPELDGPTLRRMSWTLERTEVELVVASALLDVAGARTTIRPVDGLPLLHVDQVRLQGPARAVKATVDRIGAFLALVLLSPLLLAVAVLIRWDSAGPVLYRQVRVGRNGREFAMYKFRTMHVGADRRLAELQARNDHDGVLFKVRDDPRVTRVGRFLRRYSVDELPQLVNVLLGQMSLVGPRPPLPNEVAAYPDDMRRRLVVKPGCTGLWQVSGRSDLPWAEAMRLDLRYVENWSLTLDLVIMLRTVSAVLRSSGAY